MTAPAFTPGPWMLGPWEQSRRTILGPPTGFMQAGVVAHVFGGNIATDRLIAAAPDLLAACEAQEELVNFVGDDARPEIKRVQQMRRAALAKARGEQ